MQRKGKFDYILLETTGLADPGSSPYNFHNQDDYSVFVKCLFAHQLVHLDSFNIKWWLVRHLCFEGCIDSSELVKVQIGDCVLGWVLFVGLALNLIESLAEIQLKYISI